jgi:hypothetical protein
MVHVSVQVVSSYVKPWLCNTSLISVISFVITLYINAYIKNENVILRYYATIYVGGGLSITKKLLLGIPGFTAETQTLCHKQTLDRRPLELPSSKANSVT